MELSNLYRTGDPKYTHYPGDGSGRDSYIIMNNGGLTQDRVDKKVRPTGFRAPKLAGGNFSPRKEATVFDYISDGSGRDHYITCNAGGLKPRVGKSVIDHFRSTLRDYEPATMVNLKHRRL